MDITEVKGFSKNKIESESLAREVRKRIKETSWEKQNQREGFRESFKPFIEKFEKPDDDKTKNIYTQNQEMLNNQLALTAGIRANQKAITDGFRQFERLGDLMEMPGFQAIEHEEQPLDDQRPPPPPSPKDQDYLFNLVNRFSDEDLKRLEEMGYDNPNELLKRCRLFGNLFKRR